MFKSIIASAALLASTVAASGVGSAIVVNACSYEVYIFNTPAAGGGYSEIDTTLAPGQSYKQQWTELTNGDGWSIKLSQSTSLAEIMQYEYTWHNDGIIWYDLSDVNGNPWDGNWEITATNPENTCSPKQQAYRYSTDDAYGMQACPQDSTITVTLCSGDSSDDAAASAASSSVAAIASSTAAAATKYTSAATTAASTVVVTPTTFATLTTATTANNKGETVTSVATATVTDVATQTYYNYNNGNNHYYKRHEHHPHHAHGA